MKLTYRYMIGKALLSTEKGMTKTDIVEYILKNFNFVVKNSTLNHTLSDNCHYFRKENSFSEEKLPNVNSNRYYVNVENSIHFTEYINKLEKPKEIKPKLSNNPVYKNAGKRWSQQEDNQLQTEIFSSMNDTEIAVLHFRTANAIYFRRLHLAAIYYRLSLEKLTQNGVHCLEISANLFRVNDITKLQKFIEENDDLLSL